MSVQILDEENKQYEIPTPNGENKLKENESYTCTECNSNIEIIDLDEINNILSFQCPNHGYKSISLKDYFSNNT